MTQIRENKQPVVVNVPPPHVEVVQNNTTMVLPERAVPEHAPLAPVVAATKHEALLPPTPNALVRAPEQESPAPILPREEGARVVTLVRVPTPRPEVFWGMLVRLPSGSSRVRIALAGFESGTQSYATYYMREHLGTVEHTLDEFMPTQLLRIQATTTDARIPGRCVVAAIVTLRAQMELIEGPGPAGAPIQAQGSECITEDRTAALKAAISNAFLDLKAKL
ncbi:MAG: hypothetical protein ABI995_12565 [Acidobacteriota bacterium]